MSFHEIQLHEDQPLDVIDELIRCALVDEVADEEPSSQVWQNIQAAVISCSRTRSSPSRVRWPWRQFASILQACTRGFIVPVVEANWDPRLAPRERSYLIWQQSLSLSLVPVAMMKIC
jgi:hypothetical protein